MSFHMIKDNLSIFVIFTSIPNSTRVQYSKETFSMVHAKVVMINLLCYNLMQQESKMIAFD